MKFTFSPAPNMRGALSTTRIMMELLVGLLVVYAFSLYYYATNYGSAYMIQALLIMGVSIVSCVGTEAIFALATKQKIGEFIKHSFPLITAVILALMMPVNVHLYAVAISAIMCILFAKLLFGGFGQNIFNPAALGRAVIFLAFASMVVPDFATSATPTTMMASTYNWLIVDTSLWNEFLVGVGGLGNMFLGMYPGALGETCTLLIVLVGIVLAIRKVIDWRIPVVYVSTVFLITMILGLTKGMEISVALQYGLFHILTGGLMFGAVFMATDPVTSPTSAAGRSLFALGCAIITVLIRVKANLPEGVLYSILIMNAMSPTIEKLMSFEQNRGYKKALISFVTVFAIGFGACGLAFAAVTPYAGVEAEEPLETNKLGATSDLVSSTEFEIVSVTEGEYIIKAKGFVDMNEFKVIVSDGAISSFEVVNCVDTPGIGDKITDPDFLSQFNGISSSDFEVDAISGSTYSSASAVKAAVEVLLDLGQ